MRYHGASFFASADEENDEVNDDEETLTRDGKAGELEALANVRHLTHLSDLANMVKYMCSFANLGVSETLKT